MQTPSERHSTDMLFVFLVFAVFLLSSVLLITLGTNEYRRILTGMARNDNTRIAEAYLTQKIRRVRAENAVTEGSVDGSPALLLKEEIGGRPYVTWLYVRDGYLRELITEEGRTGFLPEVGQPILPASALEFSFPSPSLLLVRVIPAENPNMGLSFHGEPGEDAAAVGAAPLAPLSAGSAEEPEEAPSYLLLTLAPQN